MAKTALFLKAKRRLALFESQDSIFFLKN